jgi:mono/diheme cytochrome c family protein
MARRSALLTLGSSLLAALAIAPVRADAPPSGATVFANHCAVCHGPQGAGVPGSFPSLHEQVVAFSKMPAGRDYLVMVPTTGLMGELQVAGVVYRGVMPAQILSEPELAAVLNYLGGGMGKAKAATPPFTPKEVADLRAHHTDRSAQNTRALRPALTEP